MLISATQREITIFSEERKFEEIIPIESLEKILKTTEHLLNIKDVIATATNSSNSSKCQLKLPANCCF